MGVFLDCHPKLMNKKVKKAENIERFGKILSTIIQLYQTKKWRILGGCLLISSLPGKVLRTLDDSAWHAERFNMRSQSQAW